MKLFKYDINLYFPVCEGKEGVFGVDGYVLAESREEARRKLRKKYEKKHDRIKINSLKTEDIIELRVRR